MDNEKTEMITSAIPFLTLDFPPPLMSICSMPPIILLHQRIEIITLVSSTTNFPNFPGSFIAHYHQRAIHGVLSGFFCITHQVDILPFDIIPGSTRIPSRKRQGNSLNMCPQPPQPNHLFWHPCQAKDANNHLRHLSPVRVDTMERLDADFVSIAQNLT